MKQITDGQRPMNIDIVPARPGSRRVPTLARSRCGG